MSIKYQLDVNFDAGFEKQIELYLANQVQKSCKKAVGKIEVSTRELLGAELKSSPEYLSLSNGILRIELGLADGTSAVNGVIEAALSSLIATVLPINLPTLGGIHIGIYREGFVDALSSSDAQYISHGKRYGDIVIKWLEWLLFRGSSKITVADIKFGNWKNSRTGKAIMVTRDYIGKSRYHAKKGRSLATSGWGVPTAFSGTTDNNWFTRVAEPILPQILENAQLSLGF